MPKMSEKNQENTKQKDIFTLKQNLNRNVEEVEPSESCRHLHTLKLACGAILVVLVVASGCAFGYYQYKLALDKDSGKCYIPYGLIKTNFDGRMGYVLRYFDNFNYHNPSCLERKDTEKYFDSNSISFFYDVSSNNSFIIDNVGKRCFIVNIDEDQLTNTPQGEETNPRITINKMEVIFPHVKDLELFKSNIRNKEIIGYTVYRLKNEKMYKDMLKKKDSDLFQMRSLLSVEETAVAVQKSHDPGDDLVCVSKSRQSVKSRDLLQDSKHLTYLLKMIGTSWLHLVKKNNSNGENVNANGGQVDTSGLITNIMHDNTFLVIEMDTGNHVPAVHSFHWNEFYVTISKDEGNNALLILHNVTADSHEKIVIFEITNFDEVLDYEFNNTEKRVFKSPSLFRLRSV